MNAITLWQPWATLIARGKKTVETRSWRPPENCVGQRIGIHASKGVDPAGGEAGLRELCATEPFRSALRYPGDCPGCDGEGAVMAQVCCRQYRETGECCNEPDTEDVPCDICDGRLAEVLPRGVFVATAKLARVGPTGLAQRQMLERAGAGEESRERVNRELAFGDYALGRWAWKLTEIIPVDPPVECKGAQKLWWVPVGVEEELQRREHEHWTPPLDFGGR